MSDPIPGQSSESYQPPPPPPPIEPEPKAPRPVKLRPVGIGVFAVGVILIVLGALNILPGGVWTGAAFAFWGIALFAFSFIPLPKTTGSEGAPMSAMEKLTAIFYAPTQVFKNLRAYPRWLAAFLVITIVTVVYAVVFAQRLTPERIVNYTMEKLEQSPIKPPPEQMEKTKEDALQQATQPVQRVQTVAKAFIGIFFFYSFVAALCLLGVLVFGGRINYWQSFAAVLYAALPVVVIQKLVSLIILFIKDPDDIHPILNQESLVQDNLGILFSPADRPALFVLGSSIGVLSFYHLWLRAKGLMNAGYKVSSAAGWGTTITLFVLSLLVGMIFATLFSSFMS